MAGGAAQDFFGPAELQSARIIDVDPDTWTMTIRSEVGEQQFYNIPVASVYTHPFEGEGIHFMPEIGAYVWVATPSEGDSRPVVIAYKALGNESASHRANRPSMNPGDIALMTRDRNGMKIRRGGVVEIFSTPLARMFFLPISNEVLTIAAKWVLQTLGGSLSWKANRKEEDPDLQQGTLFDLKMKEFANHPHPVAELKVGGQISRKEDEDQVVDFRVWQDSTIVEEDSGPLRESVSLTANRKGNLNLKTFQNAVHALNAEGGKVLPSVDLTLRRNGNIVDLEVFKDDSTDSSVKVTIDRESNLKIQFPEGSEENRLSVFVEDEEETEGVVLGVTTLTDLRASLTELSTHLQALGLPTPVTDQFLSDITDSLEGAEDGKGGGKFLSTTLRTD